MSLTGRDLTIGYSDRVAARGAAQQGAVPVIGFLNSASA